ncbi:MAG TPA: metallopeptidase family protein [Candidatus Paceibacterota bacterium]|nr:metallopeptidase family protein [Candidatus Paceibacterota bacterium]
MTREEFEKLVAEEFPDAIPEKFRSKVENVAFLVEDEPSEEVRREEGLADNETLLGLYRGIPHTARGDYYGVGNVLPDTITLYQWPIEDEAMEFGGGEANVRKVIRETIWHEVAHHFGMDEAEVRHREDERERGK